MEPRAQVSGVSASEEDEAPSSPRHQQPLRKVLKHTTPLEASPSPRRRPAGRVPSHPREAPKAGSPPPAHLSWKRLVPWAGLSPMAALQTPRLSNISASGAAGGQPGPNPDPPSPEEGPPAPATVTWQQHQRAESHGEGSWPQSWGLPGIPNVAGRRRRDLKKLEAVAERVRQWEIRLLQDVEEATQHELTVEDDCPSVLGPGAEGLWSARLVRLPLGAGARAEGLWSARLGLTDSSGPASDRPPANPSPPRGLLRPHSVPCPPGNAPLDTGAGQLTRPWAVPPEHGAHTEQEPAGDVDAYPRAARHPTSFPRATQGTG